MMSRSLSLVAASFALLTACGISPDPPTGPGTTGTGAAMPADASVHQMVLDQRPFVPVRADAAARASSAAGKTGPVVTKLLVFVVENNSLGQMLSQMPFTDQLAHRYGYATRYQAITHPSLPNYLAIAGGDTFGVTDDDSPAAHPIRGTSVFGAAIRHGRTARLYAEAMRGTCQMASTGLYAVHHNPWAYFVGEAKLCRRDDVSLRRFDGNVASGRLPAVGMVVPDLCHDAHDCPLSQADLWLRTQVRRAMSGPDWAGGHLAIVITADEDDSRNRVLTVVASPQLHHRVVHARLSHYALSRAYTDVAGVAPLRHAAAAPDLLHRFGLTTR